MRLLLIQTGFIGDVILSTPVFSFAKETFPSAEIDLLTTKVAYSLFEADRRFNQVLVFDKRGEDKGLSGFVRMVQKIRSQNYDIIISLHKSIRTSCLVFFSKSKQTLGFEQASLNFLYSKKAKREDLSHEVLRNLAIFRSLDFNPQEIARPMSLYYSDQVSSKISKIITGYSKKVVGIAPGSVWATKRWTVEGFANTAKYLSEQGYQVLLLGGAEDRELGNKIISDTAHCENLCGKLSLAESACLISKLRFLVSNDSSPLHMASAAQTPVIALFCATVPEFGFGPWMVKNRVLGVDNLECRPCGRHGGMTCPTGTHYCQIKLEASIVRDAIIDLEHELNTNTR